MQFLYIQSLALLLGSLKVFQYMLDKLTEPGDKAIHIDMALSLNTNREAFQSTIN